MGRHKPFLKVLILFLKYVFNFYKKYETCLHFWYMMLVSCGFDVILKQMSFVGLGSLKTAGF